MIEQQNKPAHLYKERPEPKLEMDVDAEGEPISTPILQSPFSIKLMGEMHRNTHVMGQLRSFRAEDLKKHREVMPLIGKAIEQKYGVSASAMFSSGGDSKAAARLHTASPEDYALLREAARYL
jgi:hypothetical protein